ncbi:MAG: hypothetical protein WC220_05560 [Pedobacter sp.]|jgi:hypothetical protein
MFNFWHRDVLGKYNPEDRWVGLDYNKLLLDPELARLTFIHEITHSVLGSTTDFGMATQTIYQLLPQMKHLTKDDRERIKRALRNSQILVQEGSATLMETLFHGKEIGKKNAIQWAYQHLPSDYWQRLEKLLFVFDMGLSYRDYFTKKIPNLAMHTRIRKQIADLDLLSSADKFINYLSNDDNNPDARFNKLIDVIRSRTYLSTKPVEQICTECGIKLFPDTSKEDVADFLNYLANLIGDTRKYTASDVGDLAQGKTAILKASEETIIANMNLNLAETGIFLEEVDHLLNYIDGIETIVVNLLGDDIDEKKELELLTGKKYEGGIVAFTNTYEKYLLPLDLKKLASLTKNELSNKTLIVKWGLYDLGGKEINLISGSRKPDVVLYNTVKNLSDKFKPWFESGKTVSYLYLGATEDHPLQSLLLKDENGVLHLVNTYGNKYIREFIEPNRKSLIREKPAFFLEDAKHINDTMSTWMGLPWEIDWFNTMLEDDIKYRVKP